MQGYLSVNYSDNYYLLSQRFPEVPRLTPAHFEAMALFNDLAKCAQSAPLLASCVMLILLCVKYNRSTELLNSHNTLCTSGLSMSGVNRLIAVHSF